MFDDLRLKNHEDDYSINKFSEEDTDCLNRQWISLSVHHIIYLGCGINNMSNNDHETYNNHLG